MVEGGNVVVGLLICVMIGLFCLCIFLILDYVVIDRGLGLKC